MKTEKKRDFKQKLYYKEIKIINHRNENKNIRN